MRVLDKDGLPEPGVLCLVIVLLAGLFVAFPQIDQVVAFLLWDGQHFLLRKHWVGMFFDQILMRILLGMFGLWCLSWMISEAREHFVLGLTRRKYVFSISSIILSAGIVTNVIFKDHWGRARPVHLEIFGGTKTFSPAFMISDQCARNCSFFSGDASFAFSFLAIALVLPKPYREKLVPAIMVFGTIVGGVRMLYGAHFLSDVIFAALFTILILQGMKFFLLRSTVRS
ncbi:MAG TPA: hypothetical protein DCW68_01290 [Rhodospirillaceae bacterium]|nr:MAG: hypothetical protein A2018_04255 [Alphaproteobacteria bacterium GWF2_58_20]HAU28733.1 hypothetical protein [Rhodospirillaceae bacterium]